MRETVEAQAEELEVLRRRVAELAEQARVPGGDDAVASGPGAAGGMAFASAGSRIARCRVVTLEEQPGEEHAFGPGAPLVAEWREVRARMGGGSAGSRVDRAVAGVRRWVLEVEMLRDFQLTLPPETEPLDDSRRKDHVRWREDALAEANREVSRAKRAWLFRRVVTLGLWRT